MYPALWFCIFYHHDPQFQIYFTFDPTHGCNFFSVMLVYLFFYYYYFLNFYNVELMSAIQQCESVMIIHLSLPSLAFLPSPHLTPLGHHRAPGWASCVIRQLLASCPLYTRRCMHADATFSIRLTPLSPLCAQVPSLHLLR